MLIIKKALHRYYYLISDFYETFKNKKKPPDFVIYLNM